jgi:predicted metal-dependent phosphotriesterase family hydrolase
MATVETALGPVDTAQLGPTLMHEHVVTRSPGVQMVLSHDANCWTDMLSEDAKRRTRPQWHYTHISDDILPALRKAGGKEDHIEQMLVRNPRAIFEARRS